MRQSNDISASRCFIGLATGDNKRPISITNPAIRALSRSRNKLCNHQLFNEDVFLDEDSGHLLPANLEYLLPADSEVGVVARLVSCCQSLAKPNRVAR